MPIYERAGANIYYEEYGLPLAAADPSAVSSILLIAPGGMKSAISFWQSTPWNPIEQLADNYHIVAMDQRNAGQSSAPVTADDGWQTYADDQLGLMTHLGIDQFHAVGMCIGGPYCLGMIRSAPQRILSATLFQTIGRDANEEAFYAMFDDWAQGLKPSMPSVDERTWQQFRENMYGGEQVLLNVDEAFIQNCETALMVLMGNDLYHPQSSSRLIAQLAPNVEFIEDWKSGDARAVAMEAFAQFLGRHSV